MDKLSPMMQQYIEVKKKHMDQLLFFRLGDFYEMFFEDAITASKELELTLTSRDCGLEERAPMCGVPYHACDTYISRLIKKGYKVAICEQMENPAQAKGVVKREVIRVVTPGTLIESNMLAEDTNNFIACILRLAEGWGLSCADISTGQLFVTQFLPEQQLELINELGRYNPSEVLFNDGILDQTELTTFLREKLHCIADLCEEKNYQLDNAYALVQQHFSKPVNELDLENRQLAVQALGALLSYLYETQRKGLERLTDVLYIHSEQYMTLDLTARRNLELTQTMRTGEKRGTLLWVLDKTKTAMGKRLLRSYLDKPLVNPALINKRLNAVEELFRDTMLRCDLSEQLSQIFDLERLMTRIIYGNATPREFKSLESTCRALPTLKLRLAGCKSAYLMDIFQKLDPLEDLCNLISCAIEEEPPAQLKDGGVIKTGFCEELDSLRTLVHNTKQILVEIETAEKEKTGIKNLKIGYNRVFGYYIEVTKSNLELVPDSYIRKQTLANCERYITQELKGLEEKILSAGERILQMEAKLFEDVREQLCKELARVQTTASALAQLDVYCALAVVANNNGYCRPDVNLSDVIEIRDGRHPVVEQLIDGAPFVSNDTLLNNSDRQIAVITGPNMAGKSTYMRQTALIVLLAQMGSFVPAASACIGVVDGIFTRVGASDDLASGQSTFMVEMTEVAQIMQNATNKSLLILDEIGRGTSTFDGMSIARAVIEYIAEKRFVGAKTLFATHYHELTELEEILPCVKNYNIACKKRGDDITFLRRIVPGGADDSYGIEVSKLAGVPEWIIKRARQVLERLEDGKEVKPVRKKTAAADTAQMSLLSAVSSEVEQALKKVDVDTLTPIEAMNCLYELKRMLK
ncbi:MAG: DNA mismatch repair protein MutS [Anaerotruncus sp.]|nr:DNA mismatch repair protein MutS [Anaerotruncus sp.]